MPGYYGGGHLGVNEPKVSSLNPRALVRGSSETRPNAGGRAASSAWVFPRPSPGSTQLCECQLLAGRERREIARHQFLRHLAQLGRRPLGLAVLVNQKGTHP